MMQFVCVLLGAAFGAAMGSFLNVVASRSVAEEKWWGNARSRCSACGTELSASELVPIFSWIVQRGACRTCGARISFRYLAVELAGGVLGGAVALRFADEPGTLLLAALLAAALLLNTLTDLESGYIFDIFALAPGAAGLVLRLFLLGKDGLVDGVLGAALGYALIVAIILASRIATGQEGMGWGDANLMAGSGALLGWKMTAVALYAGFFIGGAVILPLLLAGMVKRKDAVPLGPFLAAGGFVALFWGTALLTFFGIAADAPW